MQLRKLPTAVVLVPVRHHLECRKNESSKLNRQDLRQVGQAGHDVGGPAGRFADEATLGLPAAFLESHRMSEALSLGAIGQISRSVGDIAESCAWYGQILGLPHLYSFGRLAFFDCGGVRLFLTHQEGDFTVESILYLSVSDIQSAYGRLISRGVEFIDSPHLIHRYADGTEEWMTFFKDPEGRPLAIKGRRRI